MAGVEWVVEAFDCDAAALADGAKLAALLAAMVDQLGLHPVAPAIWHQFPGPGGITGVCLLSESHWACHTYPEHRSLTLNLFCCRPRPEWDFASYLAGHFQAARVSVRRLDRPYGGDQ